MVWKRLGASSCDLAPPHAHGFNAVMLVHEIPVPWNQTKDAQVPLSSGRVEENESHQDCEDLLAVFWRLSTSIHPSSGVAAQRTQLVPDAWSGKADETHSGWDV
jgi:hypothetical protein